MAQVLVRDLNAKVIASLKKRAQKNRRSLQGELKLILEEASRNTSLRIDEFIARAQKIRERTSGKTQTDSATLIREDRER
jgi:plasmid stability protein